MSGYNTARQMSAVAGEDLTGDIYKFCIFNNVGRVVINSTAQGIVDGIIAEVVGAAGEVTAIVIPDGGIALVKAGGVITPGGRVASDASGLAIAIGASNGDIAVGRYIGAANCASGDIIEIQFVYKGQINA